MDGLLCGINETYVDANTGRRAVECAAARNHERRQKRLELLMGEKEKQLKDAIVRRSEDIAKILARGSDVELRKTRNGLQVCAVAKQVVSK